jgi:hypothetical protein
VDASRRFFAPTGILVFDFELFIAAGATSWAVAVGQIERKSKYEEPHEHDS